MIVPETELETLIVSDPEWQEGAAWGDPRPNHPEGEVSTHIEELPGTSMTKPSTRPTASGFVWSH